jgi:thioredoxin 1
LQDGQQKIMTISVDKENFSTEVLQNDKLVLVDFWAEWCGPCKQIAPRLDEISEKYSENLSVCKVDVDSNRELALQYNVRSIPSLMIFKEGELIDSLMGAVSLEELEDLVTRNF